VGRKGALPKPDSEQRSVESLGSKMKVVQITRTALLKKDEDQNFWLVIEAEGSSASFNLTA